MMTRPTESVPRAWRAVEISTKHYAFAARQYRKRGIGFIDAPGATACCHPISHTSRKARICAVRRCFDDGFHGYSRHARYNRVDRPWQQVPKYLQEPVDATKSDFQKDAVQPLPSGRLLSKPYHKCSHSQKNNVQDRPGHRSRAPHCMYQLTIFIPTFIFVHAHRFAHVSIADSASMCATPLSTTGAVV